MLLGDIGLVEDDDHRTAELGDLRGEEEIAEQVRRVDDEHHGIRTAIAGDITRESVDDDLLVRRSGRKGVESRQVDQFDFLSVSEITGAGLAGDGDAGVIADALTQARQSVEESRLAGVGITDERDQEACIGSAHG